MYNSPKDESSEIATICANSTTICMPNGANGKQNDAFTLRWSNLSHSYNNHVNEEKRFALKSCYGRAHSATITAILGPSGAGKSTLLDCLTGRVKATTGDTFIRTSSHMIQQLRRSRVDYVPQSNEFMSLFSVNETLLFASRMNNIRWSAEEHRRTIEQLLKALDMSDKLHWPLSKLSGGQMKRVAIACSLITRPAVIVLDEPTSGLDSDNAERLIMHLKSLVTGEYLGVKPAVLLTIHSPSASVFQLFHQVYIMSRGGHNIFQGAPTRAVDYFKSFGFTQPRGNPADWCIDVANGKFGDEHFVSMARASRPTDDLDQTDSTKIQVRSMKKTSAPSLLAIRLLTWRALVYYSTRVPQLEVRMICHMVGITIYFLAQKQHILGEPFCSEEGLKSNSSVLDETAFVTMKLNMGLEDQFTKMSTVAAFGSSFISGVTYVSIVAAVMLVSLHRTIYHRELRNCWYSKKCFFAAKILSDSIIRFCATGVCGLVVYLNTRHTVEAWRVILVTGYLFLLSTIWENVAAVVTILGEKRPMIQIMGWNLLFEVVDGTLIDFLSPKNVISSWVVHAKKMSPRSNAFTGMMIALFGFGRCTNSSSATKVSITNKQTPRDMINHLWHMYNISRVQVINLLDIYDLDEEQSSNLYDSLSQWTSNEVQLHQQHPNKVLDFFEYNDTEIVQRTLVLVLWTLVTFILLGWAVRRKFT